jgi:hypothetical protein
LRCRLQAACRHTFPHFTRILGVFKALPHRDTVSADANSYLWKFVEMIRAAAHPDEISALELNAKAYNSTHDNNIFNDIRRGSQQANDCCS